VPAQVAVRSKSSAVVEGRGLRIATGRQSIRLLYLPMTQADWLPSGLPGRKFDLSVRSEGVPADANSAKEAWPWPFGPSTRKLVRDIAVR